MEMWKLASLRLYGGTHLCGPFMTQDRFWFTVLLRPCSSDLYHPPALSWDFSPYVHAQAAEPEFRFSQVLSIPTVYSRTEAVNTGWIWGTHWFHCEMGPVQKFIDHLISLSSFSDFNMVKFWVSRNYG